MKELNKDGHLDLSDEPQHFPVLCTYSPARLTEIARAMVEGDKRQVNYKNLRGYVAQFESDLEGSLGITKGRTYEAKKKEGGQ